MPRKPIALLIAASIAVLIWSCQSGDPGITNQPEARALVTVISPSFQSISEYISLNGVTVFQKKDNLRATCSGFISTLKFRLGDPVKRGEVYFLVGTKEQDALRNLSSRDSSLHKFQDPLPILANVSGIITTISSIQGDYVNEGDVLANVSEPASLIIQVNVPYEYNQYVSPGKNCEIVLPDGRIIRESISGSMPTIDPSSQSQTYFIRLPGQALPENLNVKIRIPVKQKNNALCVPTACVQTDEMQGEFWLMKVVNDTLAIKVPVVTGLQNDSMTEVISDRISVSDRIILQGAYALADSTHVLIGK